MLLLLMNARSKRKEVIGAIFSCIKVVDAIHYNEIRGLVAAG